MTYVLGYFLVGLVCDLVYVAFCMTYEDSFKKEDFIAVIMLLLIWPYVFIEQALLNKNEPPPSTPRNA